jgi:hypothetical protein
MISGRTDNMQRESDGHFRFPRIVNQTLSRIYEGLCNRAFMIANQNEESMWTLQGLCDRAFTIANQNEDSMWKLKGLCDRAFTTANQDWWS